MKDQQPEELPKKPCLVCRKPYKAPYARVSGSLGVCSKACESVWNKRISDEHPKGESHVRTLPTK